MTFPIKLVDGHLLFDHNGNTILVDTGSPVTVHNSECLQFLDREFNVPTSIIGKTVDDIGNLAGLEFSTLMGMDILSQYRVILDYENRQITFLSPDEQGFEGTEIPLYKQMGSVGIEVNVAGKNFLMAVDTGAPISYIPASVTDDLNPVGEKEDFHPVIGRYVTPVYELESTVAGRVFTVSYGNLPNLLARTLLIAKIDGVIGYDFFKSFKIMFDFGSGRAIISPIIL